MNRFVVLGVALFIAIVGMALIGADNTAEAGHGCHECGGCGGCLGLLGCYGCGGCAAPSCCAPAPPSCCGCAGAGGNEGEKIIEDGAGDDVPEAPPEAEASFDRAPTAFRTVSFRR